MKKSHTLLKLSPFYYYIVSILHTSCNRLYMYIIRSGSYSYRALSLSNPLENNAAEHRQRAHTHKVKVQQHT